MLLLARARLVVLALFLYVFLMMHFVDLLMLLLSMVLDSVRR